MHGFEYQAAIHMIQEGLEEEGLECIRAVRDRYDGEKRNPWNEYECGSNYARSMASYALLLTYSGFRYHMGEKMIGFAPIHEEDFSCFWSLDAGWGKVSYSKKAVEIQVLYGTLPLAVLEVKCKAGDPIDLEIDGQSVPFTYKERRITFTEQTVKQRILIRYQTGGTCGV